jgi:tetratricopeptide (TPR) repeat protein
VRRIAGALLIVVIAGFTHGARSQGADTSGEVPLRVQLEGLAPAPRIAYLRYLLGQGSEEAEVYFQLGVAFHESDLPDSAIRYYSRAAAESDEYSKAFVNIGVIYDEQGKSAQALEMFEKGMRVNPDDVLAHAHAAFTRFLFKDYTTAWEYLSRALEIDPDDPQAHFYLAIFFWESRMYREALVEWERVTALDTEGFLARKAQENIVLLQKALNAPSSTGGWKPKH